MQNQVTSITDIPRDVTKNEVDQFGITSFEKGLVKFIEHTNTPITIALQGEWGSGKTSLMNSLNNSLCKNNNCLYHSVWLNTWEHALMKDAESTLVAIILQLTKEVVKIANLDEAKSKKVLTKALNIGRGLGKSLAKNVGNKVLDGLGDAVADQLNVSETESNIGEIRNELENIIAECIEKDSKHGFIFFIDDLDRIDPPVAVNLLELLKNIFNLNHCVFVLAIDYDVVVKGLEPKFGIRTDANEREFRSFFDKIIQVPFSMPVASYGVDTFLRESLSSINYLEENQLSNVDLMSHLSSISGLSVGTNPRSLKRLINSLSLINCINDVKGNKSNDEVIDNDLKAIVNFALVSLQIAYPPVYNLLNTEPDFTSWNDATARKLNLAELSDEVQRKLDDTEEFDEIWEKVLFRVCERDNFLKRKALNISRILNKLKLLIEEKEETVEDTIVSVIKLSSVTNVDAVEPTKEIDYHKGEILKSIRRRLFDYYKVNHPTIASKIKPLGARVQSNARIQFLLNDRQDITLRTHYYNGQIRLIIMGHEWVLKDKGMPFEEHARALGKEEHYNKMYNDFTTITENTRFEQSEWLDYTGRQHGFKYITLYLYYSLPTPENFKEPEHIQAIAEILLKLQPIQKMMQQLRWASEQ